MVHKAFDILRQRWPEVMLIVVLHTALMIFADELASMSETMAADQGAPVAGWAGFLMGFGSILYAIVWMMLYLGFFKTAATEGTYPQQPMELIRRGRPYFWSIFGFQILFGIFLWIITGALVAVSARVIWRTNEITNIPDWFANVCVMAGVLFLIKPLLFIPARIIVCDDSIILSAAAMRHYRLGDVSGLYGLIAAGIGGIMLFMFISGLVPERTAVYYILAGMHHLVFSLVFLWMTLTAVLWVKVRIDEQQAYLEESQAQS